MHRDRWIAARGMLRSVLAEYVGTPPEALQFSYDMNGKPDLKHPTIEPPVRFNLSHSGAVAVVAVGRSPVLGVDVEEVRSGFDFADIAERQFSAAECRALTTVPADQRRLAFYLAWTRKEAFIKALGTGLGRPLDSFDVSLVPGAPQAILSIEGSTTDAAAWQLFDLEPRPCFVGALAVRSSKPAELRLRHR